MFKILQVPLRYLKSSSLLWPPQPPWAIFDCVSVGGQKLWLLGTSPWECQCWFRMKQSGDVSEW